STVRMPRVDRRSFTSAPRISDNSVVSCRFGRKRRRVLLLAWLTLLPVSTPLPVISQRRDIGKILGRSGHVATAARDASEGRPYGETRARRQVMRRKSVANPAQKGLRRASLGTVGRDRPGEVRSYASHPR